jgi:hypothetical protein
MIISRYRYRYRYRPLKLPKLLYYLKKTQFCHSIELLEVVSFRICL